MEKIFVIVIFTLAVPAQSLKKLPPPLSVCEVLEQSSSLDGKEITVEGLVFASDHGVALIGSSCNMGFALSYRLNRSNKASRRFELAVRDQLLGLHSSSIHAEVRGVYHDALPFGDRTIRQLEIVEYVSVPFLTANRH